MINTLATLLAALTVGTIILMVMETPPIRPEVRDLIAAGPTTDNPLDIIRLSDTPIRTDTWRNIVVTAGSSPAVPQAANSHFIIDARSNGTAAIRATSLWKNQARSRFLTGANATFSDTVIAVCLIGDFSTSGRLAESQLRDLTALVRALQLEFGVSPGHVYLHSDIVAYSPLPGRGFPADQFNSSLLRIR